MPPAAYKKTHGRLRGWKLEVETPPVRAVRLRRAIARARPRTHLNCWRRAIYRSPEIHVFKNQV